MTTPEALLFGGVVLLVVCVVILINAMGGDE